MLWVGAHTLNMYIDYRIINLLHSQCCHIVKHELRRYTLILQATSVTNIAFQWPTAIHIKRDKFQESEITPLTASSYCQHSISLGGGGGTSIKAMELADCV